MSAAPLYGIEGVSVSQFPLTMNLVYPGNGVLLGKSKKIWIGLHIVREDGWHTYWKHPGDVGIVPSIKWELPAGYSTGKIIFQPPQRVSMFDIRANGHTGETLFLIPFSIPPLTSVKELEIKGVCSWMACSYTCMPASTPLSLKLPVVSKFVPDFYWAAQFKKFWATQPKEIPKAWDFDARLIGKFLKLKFPIFLSAKDRKLDFFAENRVVLSNQSPIVRKKEDRLVWMLKKSPWGPPLPNEINGLLSVEEGGGKNFYRLRIPVSSNK
jgi:DsbC/DsbD-like thiol-disulfide interchange protein